MSDLMQLAPGVNGQLNFTFDVELHGKKLDGVVDVSGLAVEITAIDDKAVSLRGQLIERKIPGKTVAPGTITVKMSTKPGAPVERAHWMAIGRGMPLMSGPATVALYDRKGKVVQRWQLLDVFIKDLSWSDFGAGDAQLAELSLTLQYNDVKVTR
jgi:phage tail-like protein